jgi:hypothetical protein
MLQWLIAAVVLAGVLAVVRTLLTLVLIAPFRSQMRARPWRFYATAFISTGTAAYVAILATTAALTRFFGVASPVIILLAVIPPFTVYFLRLLQAADTADPEVYNAMWQPDPSRSDAWNLEERLRLDARAKSWSLLGLVLGATAPFIGPIQAAFAGPTVLTLGVAYFAIGLLLLAVSLGGRNVGNSGIGITVAFALIAWPILFAVLLQDYLRYRRLRA